MSAAQKLYDKMVDLKSEIDSVVSIVDNLSMLSDDILILLEHIEEQKSSTEPPLCFGKSDYYSNNDEDCELCKFHNECVKKLK